MDCAICKTPMITMEWDEVETDFCPSCEGIWLDVGELEELLGSSEQAKSVLESFTILTNCTEKPRQCPICHKNMLKVQVGSSQDYVLIDRCKKEHGLWFDKNELQDILKKASFDPDKKVNQLLTDMFEPDQDQTT